MNVNWQKPDRVPGSNESRTLGDLVAIVMDAGLVSNRSDAEKLIRKKIPQESHYQQSIIRELRKRANVEGMKCVCWKAAQGPYSRGGVSDVLAMIGGVFFAVEVKRPLLGSTSALQQKFIDEVINAGGVACVAIYPEDLDEVWSQAAMIREAWKR